jgi:hypothetical protein
VGNTNSLIWRRRPLCRVAGRQGAEPTLRSVLTMRPAAVARSPVLHRDRGALGTVRVVVVYRAIGRLGRMPREGDRHWGLWACVRDPIASAHGPCASDESTLIRRAVADRRASQDTEARSAAVMAHS